MFLNLAGAGNNSDEFDEWEKSMKEMWEERGAVTLRDTTDKKRIREIGQTLSQTKYPWTENCEKQWKRFTLQAM